MPPAPAQAYKGPMAPTRTFTRLALTTLALLLAGCAHVHVDDQGRRHVIGLVWLTLPPPPVEPVGAESLRTRSVGLAVTRSPAGGGVTLGYQDSTLTVIRNDALVRMPAPPAKEEPR